ncbi:3-hydroxyacyl-CoA dehydrogenase family protein [Halovenus halobia]|uniref:3-hydroxyacyl-CoA dehydrogenase family protein n=1 Tax=Halovenus halobia TaxID=3396622 RepID=UPI003F54EA1C
MNVAVLGTGATGRDIAVRCAQAGSAVSLQADDATAAMDRVDDIEGVLINAVESGRITESRKDEALSQLEATTDLSSATAGAEVVFDTATTEAEALQERFAVVESAVEQETLIVTTQPGVSVTAAAAGLRHPDRALGMHFVDAPEAAVVELIVPDGADEEAVERAESFVSDLGATPIRVRDTPGLVSARVRLAIEAEAMRTVEDDAASVDGVDTILKEGYKYPEGPLARADRVGLDKRLETLSTLTEALGPRFEPPAILERLVEEGKTGASTGEGFYHWERNEPVEPAVETERLPTGQPSDPTTR